MGFISATLGRFSPRHRTLDQWTPIYAQLVAAQDICDKTRANRRSYIRRITEALGTRTIGAIRPHEIATLIATISSDHPQLAVRVLVEARTLFNAALENGWVDANPAMPVRKPIIKISRERLSLKQWQDIHDYADCCSPPWVSRMMALALVTGQRRGDLRKMRFSDVWDGHLHIEQEKTKARVAIPLTLRLDEVGLSVLDVVEACRGYARLDGDSFLLRKTTGDMLSPASMSWRFEQAREGALPPHKGVGTPPSLHECRSLAERLYREQGVNTMLLLGHTRQSMTDLYNKNRGKANPSDKWKSVPLPGAAHKLPVAFDSDTLSQNLKERP